jgi:predicted transcriptional regulator
MTRKKEYISQFFLRDKNAFTALSRTGIVSAENLKLHCNLADSRIKNYVRDGYAEKILFKEGKEVKEAYTLTSKGRELVERQWNARNHYHAQTKSPHHDLQLSDKYFSLSEQVRNTWRTESQVREHFKVKLEELRQNGQSKRAEEYYNMMQNRIISMPDAVYTNEDGIEVAYEVITGNYGRQEMLAKEIAVSILQYSYETERI